MSDPLAPRQLIVLCDGTNNNLTGGQNDTNVVKLAELFARHPNPERLVHYDPGVGNPGEMPGATVVDGVRRWFERIEGLAVGRGVYENIAEAYTFLMRHWRDRRDRIFLFGFSRGAFTARSVAGLINRFGLLQPHLECMVPTLLHLYFSDRNEKHTHQTQQSDAIGQQIMRLFAGGAPTGADGQPNPATRRVFVYFTGVWDMVASVGAGPFALRITAPPTMEHKVFVHVRQALALDEHRSQFRQRLYLGENSDRVPIAEQMKGTLKQMWFRGAHCDVGGYYPAAESALSDQAMAWLVSEAVAVGLWLGPSAQVRNEGSAGGEQAVLQALRAAQLSPTDAKPVLHSQQFETPLWALAGLSQRETQHVVLDDGTSHRITPVTHPSVQAFDEDPAATVQWNSRKRPLAPLAWALLACVLLLPLLGWMLEPCVDSASWGSRLACVEENNLRFQAWQLLGLAAPFVKELRAVWTQAAGVAFGTPRWVLLWDFALIAAYAMVLAHAVTWAFARAAGLRDPLQPPSRALNLLGRALPLMVLADVAENLLGLATFTALQQQDPGVQHLIGILTGFAAGIASVLKFVGLAGVLALVAWGVSAGRARAR